MLKISISYFDWQTIVLTFSEKKTFSGFIFMFKQFERIIEVFIRFFAWATFH